MANALNLLASGANVSVAAAAVINDLSTFTVLTLVRNGSAIGTTQGSIVRKRALATGNNTAGWRFDADNNNVPRSSRFRVDYSTTDLSYRTGQTTPLPFPTTNTWGWVASAVDLSGATGARVRVYASAFGGSFAETEHTGSGGAEVEPVGTRLSDAGLPLLIGDTTEGPNAIAFVGLYPGQRTAAQLDAWVANMAGEAANTLASIRVGWTGVSGTDDAGPNGLSITTNGTPSLVTDAPDYWTGGGTVARPRINGFAPILINGGLIR